MWRAESVNALRFFLQCTSSYSYMRFPYCEGSGGSSPTSRKFAHAPHLEKFPPVDSPPPNIYHPPPPPKCNPLPPLNNNFQVITQ